METQKIVNLLNDSDNESSKFATRKWHIINDQNNGQYGRGNENNATIKFENGTLFMIKIMDNMAEEMKTMQPLNLKQKSLNEIFVITQMHIFLRQEI